MIPFGTAYERARYVSNGSTYKYPLDETAGSNASDDAQVFFLTANGSPGAASTLWDSNETSGRGSRTFNGTTQYFSAVASTALRDVARGNWTFTGWVKPDVVSGTRSIYFVGGVTGDVDGSENYLIKIAINGTELQTFWEYGTGTNVTTQTSGASLQAGATYFFAIVKEDDRANAGKKQVTFYIFNKTDLDAGALAPFKHTADNITNTDGGTGTVGVQIGAGSYTAANEFFDGTLSDLRFDANTLDEPEIWDIIAGYYRTWNDEDVIASDAPSEHWKLIVKDDDGAYRDLSKLGDFSDNFQVGFEQSGSIDQKPQELRITLARARAGVNLSPLDENSPINQDSGGYTDFLGPMREIWLKYCLCPKDVEPTDVQYVSLFRGWTDEWKGSTSGNKITIPCRDMWAQVQDTQIKPISASQDQKTYGSDSSPVLAELVMQEIVDDNDRTYTWKLGRKPVIYTPTASAFGIVGYWQMLEPVASAWEKLATQNGWDIRFIYQPGMYTWRPTFYEPDRSTSTADHTFTADDFSQFDQMSIGLKEYRNDIEIQYFDRNGTPQPNGDDPRLTQSATASAADLARYGEWYMRARFLPNITTSTEAAGVAAACLNDLDVPQINLSASRGFFPFVQLNDYYDFGANVWWSSAKKAAVRSFVHQGSKDGIVTRLHAEGQPKSMKKGWLDVAVHPGVGPNYPLAKLGSNPNPSCSAIVGGINVTWSRFVRAGRNADFHYKETEVWVDTSTPVDTTTASNLKAVTASNNIDITGLTPGTTHYVLLVHVDEFGGRTESASECSAAPLASPAFNAQFHAYMTADQTGISGSTALNLDGELFDPGGNYDAATNYEYTVPATGIYHFTASIYGDTTSAPDGFYIDLERNTGAGYGSLTRSTETADDPGFCHIATTIYCVAGWKFRISATAKGTITAKGSSNVYLSYFTGTMLA